MSRSHSLDEMAGRRDLNRAVMETERPVETEDDPPELARNGSTEHRPRPGDRPEVRKSEGRTIEPRKRYEHRGCTYTLRSSEIQTLAIIGTFRAVATKDLQEFAYGGDRKHLDADLTNLRRQGLTVERDIPHPETRPCRLVALTKEGQRVLAATKTVAEDQILYHGFKKPREAHHDADLYRLYERGIQKIERDGGTNVRVILDSELKRILYRDLAAAEANEQIAELRAEVAAEHGLRVVDGKIPVPDLRLEYVTSDHEPAHLDLELATEHYRYQNIAQKVRAGFSIYARPQDASNLRRVLEQQELTAEILNL
jgi:hypothetical protein